MKDLNPIVQVIGVDGSSRLGFLYMQNEHFVVILNNIVDKADLGPLQFIRREHIEPEADVLILPRSNVLEIKLLEEASEASPPS